MSVVLPAPLSPTRPTTSPGMMSRLTSLTAVSPPNRLTRLRTDSIGSMSASLRSADDHVPRLVDEHREDDHDADDDELPERVDAQQDEAGDQDGDDERPDDRAHHVP